MLYKYLDSIWPEAPNGPVEGNFWSEIVYDYAATYSPIPITRRSTSTYRWPGRAAN